MLDPTLAQGGIAVITGAASGVGFAAAQTFARQGLGVVLADLPGDALLEAQKAIRELAHGDVPVEAIPTDVRDADAVSSLADKAFNLGSVAVLMNNAGIALPSHSWKDPENWRDLIEINLFGVLNGVQSFVPRMVEANRPGMIINTGSKQGITCPPGSPAYNVSKAGVKVLTEMLAHDLRQADAPISAHLFVPGFTYTGLVARYFPEKPEGAWSSEQAVAYLFERLAENEFYILCPDNDVNRARDEKRIAWAAGDLIESRPALSRWHPDFKDAFARFEQD